MIREGNTAKTDFSAEHLSTLVYGTFGSGKTFFGASAPGPYFISADEGLLGLKILRRDIPFVEFDDYQDCMQILDDIKLGRRAQVENGIRTIILDGLDRMTQLIIDLVLKETNKTQMNLRTWEIAVEYLRVLVRKFVSLKYKYHLIALTGDKFEKNREGQIISGAPDTIGALRRTIGGLFDLVVYAYQGVQAINGRSVETFTLNTIKFSYFPAKDRSTVLNPTEPNDFKVIWDKIQGAMGKEDNTARKVGYDSSVDSTTSGEIIQLQGAVKAL